MRRKIELIGISLLFICIIIAMLSLIVLLVCITVNGAKVISISFLIESPKAGMTKGGIFPALVGSFLLASGSILFAMPLGVLSAVYLVEYAKNKKIVRIVRVGVNALSGVPSVVFGLFGLAIFVRLFGFGVSIISGSLTLGVLILPMIISASEEAMRAVPEEFREASFALGANRWQTTRKVVIPTALPGILTGMILGIARAAGETAPIMFTAATFFKRGLPDSLLDDVMALPYHIYALMTEGTKPEYQTPIAFGTALVLLLLVLGINILAIIIRTHIRMKRRW